jgi:hypothetical protein
VPRPLPILGEALPTPIPLYGVVDVLRSDGTDQCIKSLDPDMSEPPFSCWGFDHHGELGIADASAVGIIHPYPQKIQAIPALSRDLVRGQDHGCAIVTVAERDEVWCYGIFNRVGNGKIQTGGPQLKGASVEWLPENFQPILDASK